RLRGGRRARGRRLQAQESRAPGVDPGRGRRTGDDRRGRRAPAPASARHPPGALPDRSPACAVMTWPRLSPDGRWVAFQVIDTTGVTAIWVRPLDALEARALNGTE